MPEKIRKEFISSEMTEDTELESAVSGSLIPYFVSTGTKFTIPANKQMLYARRILLDGDMVIDGELIEVR